MSETQEVVVTGTPVTSRRQKMEAPTKTYKLKAGAKHHMDGEAVGADEEVALTDAEFTAFADKFEPTGKTSSARRSGGKLAQGVEEMPELGAPPVTAARVDHLPQDIGGKTPDLSAPAANPGNLTRGTQGQPRVAGGVPVRAEALQGVAEAGKGEDKPQQDGPVNPGQIPPERDVAAATVAGGVQTAVTQQAEPAKPKADKK